MEYFSQLRCQHNMNGVQGMNYNAIPVAFQTILSPFSSLFFFN